MRVCGPAETSETYRAARAALLEAEMALRDQREVVAALRRELPTGEAVPDYVFREGSTDLDDEAPQAGTDVRLSELFSTGKDALIVVHLMYAPEDESACPMCTMWADGYNGIAQHLLDRVSLAVVARAEIGKFRRWGRGRGWRNLRLLSSLDNTFNADFAIESATAARANSRPSASSCGARTAASATTTPAAPSWGPISSAVSTSIRRSGICSTFCRAGARTCFPSTRTARTHPHPGPLPHAGEGVCPRPDSSPASGRERQAGRGCRRSALMVFNRQVRCARVLTVICVCLAVSAAATTPSAQESEASREALAKGPRLSRARPSPCGGEAIR